MQQAKSILCLVIFTIALLGCTNDEASLPEIAENRISSVEQYNSGQLYYDIKFTYNSDNTVKKIVSTKYLPWKFRQEINVEYQDGRPSFITELLDYDDPRDTDRLYTYEVTYGENSITMLDEKQRIVIEHTDNWIERYTVTALDIDLDYEDQLYVRDSAMNLIATTWREGAVKNLYSFFDSGKKVSIHSDMVGLTNAPIYTIFNLKYSAMFTQTKTELC